MSVRTARRWLFLVVALTVPMPMLAGFDALVPAVRYLLLAAAIAAVVLQEGGAGPVPLLLALFAGQGLLYLCVGWLMAWLVTRPLESWTDPARRNLTIAVMVVLLAVALGVDLYRTPFGRAPTGNLLAVLS